MLEANSFAWTDLCLTLPSELTDRDTIAGRTTDVSAALETAATNARSDGTRALAAELQRSMAGRSDRNEFVRIRPESDGRAESPAAG